VGPGSPNRLSHRIAARQVICQWLTLSATPFTLTPDRATGEAYCLAHHVTVDGGKRRLMVASLRYLDTFVKIDGGWFFSERRLNVDWMEERALS
jgi:hypothetical protein